MENSPSALLLLDLLGPTMSVSVLPLTEAPARDVIVPFLDDHRNNLEQIAVLHSCNGLLLCYITDVRLSPDWRAILTGGGLIYVDSSSSSPLYRRRTHSGLLVCNPTTRYVEVFGLPGRVKKIDYKQDAYYLSFEPEISPHYKVISVLRVDETYQYQVKIYSSITGSWSDTVIHFNLASCIPVTAGVYCKNAIHWCSGLFCEQIYFDIESESVKVWQMPPRESRDFLHFDESGGRLQLVLVRDVPGGRQFDRLELSQDYCSWSLKCCSNANTFFNAIAAGRRLTWDTHSPFGLIRPDVAYVDEEKMLVLHDWKVVRYRFVDSDVEIWQHNIWSTSRTRVPLKYIRTRASFGRAHDHNEGTSS